MMHIHSSGMLSLHTFFKFSTALIFQSGWQSVEQSRSKVTKTLFPRFQLSLTGAKGLSCWVMLTLISCLNTSFVTRTFVQTKCFCNRPRICFNVSFWYNKYAAKIFCVWFINSVSQIW